MKIGQIKNAVAGIQQFELFLLVPESTIADHVQLTVGGTAHPTLSLVHQRWPNGSVRSASVFSNLPVTAAFQDVIIANQPAGSPAFLTQAQIATTVAGTTVSTTGPVATRSMVTDVNAGKWQIRPMQSVGGTAVVTPVIVCNFDAGAEITHFGAKMRPLYEAVIWSPTLAHVSVTLDQADSEALPLIKRDYANITINIGSTVALNQSNVILGTGTINTIQKWIGTPNDSHEFLFDRIFLNTSGMYLNAPAGPFDLISWYNPAVATMNSANPNAQGFGGDGILGASVVADSMSAGGAGGRSDLGWRPAQQIYAYLLGTKDSRKLAITLARQYTAFPLFLRERNASKVIDSTNASGLNLPLSSYDRPSLGIAARTLAGASLTTINSDVQFYSSGGVALAKGQSGSSPTSWIGIYQDWNTEGAKFDDIGHFSPYWFSANVFQPRHLWCEANYFAANFAYHVWPEQYSNDPDNRASVNTIDYAANRSPGMAKIGNGEGQREMFRNFAVLADAVAMLPNATNTGFNALQTTLSEVIEAINGYFKIQNVSVIENWWYTVRNATSLSAADKQLGYLNHEGPYTNVGELYPASAIDTSTANQRKAQNGYAQWMDMEGLYAFKSFVRRGYTSGQGILDYIAFGARNRAGSSSPSVFGQYTEPKVDWTTGLSYSSAAAVIADADLTECNKNWPGGANFPASPSIAANLESGYAVVRQAIAKLLLDMGAANNSAATNSLLAGPANSYFSIYPKFHFEQVICTPPTITTAGTTVFSGVQGTQNAFGAQVLPVVSPSNVTTLFSLISAPTWASINALTGAVSIAAGSAVGNFNSVRLIGNGCLPNADQNISFVISAATGVAPSFTSPNTSSGASGSQPSYTATATGTTPIAFSIAPAVAGWSINASTGVVTGPILTANQSITIVATNGVAPPASQVVSFTVSALPQLVIIGLPSTTVTGNTYPITVTSNGVALAGVAITIDGNQVGVTNSLGQFNLVMPAIGFSIPVYADKVGYEQALQVINITAFPVGPTITSAASWTGTHGQTNTFTHTATSGTPPYVWSISNAPAGAIINPSTGGVTFPASIP